LVVYGSVQYLENIHEYLSEQTGLEVSLARPVAELDLALPSVQEEELSALSSQLTSAVGLAADAVYARRVELNLVPSETLTRVRTFGVIKFAVIAWFILLLCAAGIYSGKLKDRNAVQAEVDGWERKIRQIEPTYYEAVAMKNDAESLMPPLRSLYELVASQYSWPVVLVELRTVIPDTIWLKKFDFDSNGNTVEIEGTCWYPTDLMRFLVQCHHSNIFTDVELSSQQESQGATDLLGNPGDRILGGGGGGGGASLGGPQFGSPVSRGIPRGGSMGDTLASYFRPDYRELGQPHLWDFTLKMTLMPGFNQLGLENYDAVFSTGGGGGRGSAGGAAGGGLPGGGGATIGGSIGGPQP